MASRHRPISPRARTSFVSRLLVPVLIAGLIFAGLAVVTVVNGGLTLPFGGGVLFAFDGEEAGGVAPGQVRPAGTVPVYALPRPLPAYTEITVEHLLTKDGLHEVPVNEEFIEARGLFRKDLSTEGINRILGRVLNRNCGTNRALRESDFYPKDTRAGPTAAISPGLRGIWIDISDVQGLADVRVGDCIDLIAARSEMAASPADSNVLGNLTDPIMRARLQRMSKSRTNMRQTSSWMVARNARVINPKRSRALTAGKPQPAGPPTVEEVFLAMKPSEVALFSQALAQDVSILAAPRSGQPEDAPTEIEDSKPVDVEAEMRRMLTGDDAVEPVFGVVEVIRGGERHSVTVPRAEKEDDGR